MYLLVDYIKEIFIIKNILERLTSDVTKNTILHNSKGTDNEKIIHNLFDLYKPSNITDFILNYHSIGLKYDKASYYKKKLNY
jgi:hypothetical protein